MASMDNPQNWLNLFQNFSLWSVWRVFLLVYFLGYLVFNLILSRQITLMSQLFETNLKGLLKIFNWLLFGLGVLGFLMALTLG